MSDEPGDLVGRARRHCVGLMNMAASYDRDGMPRSAHEARVSEDIIRGLCALVKRQRQSQPAPQKPGQQRERPSLSRKAILTAYKETRGLH